MLWTPHQPIITPTCPHCGGLRRDWLRAHRRHAGLSMHRVCCCVSEATCDSNTTLQITVVGVDTGFCSECGGFIGDNSNRLKIVDLSVDGVYGNIPHLQQDENICEYVSCVTQTMATLRAYSESPCTGSILNDCTADSLYISVGVDLDTQKVTRVQLSGYADTSCAGNGTFDCEEADNFGIGDAFNSGSVNANFGESIPNSISCNGFVFGNSNSGEVVVDIE